MRMNEEGQAECMETTSLTKTYKEEGKGRRRDEARKICFLLVWCRLEHV